MLSVNPNDYESMNYFQKVLRTTGIIDKLEELGIQDGDTVSIYDFEFEFMN
jgi:GTP-binding protein